MNRWIPGSFVFKDSHGRIVKNEIGLKSAKTSAKRSKLTQSAPKIGKASKASPKSKSSKASPQAKSSKKPRSSSSMRPAPKAKAVQVKKASKKSLSRRK